MARLIGELLLEVLGTLIRGWAYALWLKVAAWLDTKVRGRAARIAVGLFLGLAAFVLVPLVTGLLVH